MNKSRLDRGLYKSIAAILIVNNFAALATIRVNAEDIVQNNATLIENVSQARNNIIHMNGDFEDTFKTTSSDAYLWKDEVKPRNWEISSYGQFAPTMIGEITSDSKSGNNAVKITLDKSVGFFKSVTTTSPKIEKDKEYKISTWIKGEDLAKADCSVTTHSPILVKVEQLDSSNKVLETITLGTVSGTTDWSNFESSFRGNENASRLRMVVQFDSGLHVGTSGVVYIDDFKLEEVTPKPQSITLSEESVKMSLDQSGVLKYNIDPIEASKEPVVWNSSDSSVVEVKDGVITSKKEGSATITVWLENYPDLKSQCNIEVSNSVDIERVEFENSIINIDNNNNYIVKAKAYPEYTTESYNLEVEDINVATIKDGIVTAINTGTTNIIAKTIDGKKELGRFELKVNEHTKDTYDSSLDKIYNSLVPNNLLSSNDIKDKEAVDKIVSVANIYWNNMNKDNNKNYLWKDLDSTTNSNHITKSFERLREMAKAFLLEGSELQGDSELIKDIVYGIEWLMENRYNEDYYGNWWDWQIGAPQRLTDTLVLIKDYLTAETIKKYTDIIDYYVPNARDQWSPRENPIQSEGANRLDMCQVVIYRSLLIKDSEKLQEASNDLLPELQYVTEKNGIYEDGSIIQHDAIPYTGTYGAILLTGIGRMNYLLEGTEWAIPSDKVNIIYDVIEKSFEPLMYKGLIMDMVNGRSISRSKWQDINNGEGVMKSIVKYFIPAATPDEALRLKGVVKYWLQSNDSKDMVETTNDLEFRAMIKDILNDSKIKPSKELIGHYNYANMDRVVHRRPGFVYGISTYSNRTYMYEAMNKENTKGYHTADGMTYLYNGDVEQFSKGFWPTVDPYRLPGTTVDTVKLYNEASGSKVINGENWVGGSTIEGRYGASGMYLDKENPKEKDEKYKMDLKAKKSWFMFDDEVVSIGSDITSTKGRTIETVVENRRLSEKGNEVFTVDGQASINNIGDKTSKEGVSWAHLKGSKENTDIGYYFPNKADINILRDHRTGNWNDINETEPSLVEENNFLTMWVDHGIDPENESYSYVLLPNKSEEEVKEYNENPNIEILENNEGIHAVRENTLNITAANFWEDNQSIDFISTDKKSSVMVKEDSGVLRIGVSDPTMENEGTIRVELDKNIEDVINKDDRVKVVESSDKLILEINVKDAKGSTINAEFKIKEENKLNAPTDIKIEKIKGNQVSLTWKNLNNNKKVKFYEVYLDGKYIDKVNNEKIKLKISKDEHILNLYAVDKQGNKSDMSKDFVIKK
ncbi:hypothetical protein CHL78_006485 [Romboutsia weinsteinii]|uniref:Hyaluronate lyase n=1 Tax=Romboutsia weinsteinii TaxID=2020949 RepID=A0A371J618_9FIRM|nr:polysaccharide lyase family 8 super-sandwich domain-containing protein [Romboutsia weinsteinii]RDY28230.1 hypothetical protein CHL78_006485 [Romboutsia weinsteinii]